MGQRASNAYRVQGEETPEETAPHIPEPRGGYQGRGRGGFGGRGRGQITCYNCGQPRQLARDYQQPPRMYFNYCNTNDHVIEDCAQLIAKWKAKGN